MRAIFGAVGEPPIAMPGLGPDWEPGAIPVPEPEPLSRTLTREAPSPPPTPKAGKGKQKPAKAPQSPGERVLARICALGDDHPSEDYRQALADVLKVLTECAPDCHEAGHR